MYLLHRVLEDHLNYTTVRSPRRRTKGRCALAVPIDVTDSANRTVSKV